MGHRSWHFITGEYPPQPGGVSDYCWHVTHALAKAGEEVHVWAPPTDREPKPPDDDVRLHRLRGRFGFRTLLELTSLIKACHPPRRVFVQYVANTFGFRAMNVLFCLWLLRHRADPIWLMFHEYAYPFRSRNRPTHHLLAAVTSIMGALAAARADRIFVSTPTWEKRLPSSVRRSTPITWLPIPSNVPVGIDDRLVEETRQRIVASAVTGQGRPTILGHFGTYNRKTSQLLLKILPGLLRNQQRTAFLIGRGSEQFVDYLKNRQPEMRDRIAASGSLPAERVAASLRACDVLVQPYPDGITSRRGSLMAGLALGLPIISNVGDHTDPIWLDSNAVALAGSAHPEEFIPVADEFLSAPARWSDLGHRASELYRKEFSLERSVSSILELAAQDDDKDRKLAGVRNGSL